MNGLLTYCITPNLEDQGAYFSLASIPQTCSAWLDLPEVQDFHWCSSGGHWGTQAVTPLQGTCTRWWRGIQVLLVFSTFRFLQEYGKHNLTFWGLTAQNEPTDGYIYKHFFQAMGFTPEQQRDFIKLDLGPALHNNSFGDVKLMILDDNRLLLPYWAEKVSVIDWMILSCDFMVPYFTKFVACYNGNNLGPTHENIVST